ncbi:hypothetical protein BC826DRAFT_1036678, partial [Russula brevipes]
QATAHKLTDDALLDIFDFYLNDDNDPDGIYYLDKWHTLVHVCRRWRDLVHTSEENAGYLASIAHRDS